jgi:hypothetical protein
MEMSVGSFLVPEQFPAFSRLEGNNLREKNGQGKVT